MLIQLNYDSENHQLTDLIFDRILSISHTFNEIRVN